MSSSGSKTRKVGQAPTVLQLKILRAKVNGRTDGAVARAFKLGERTVQRHIDDLMRVLGVGCRAELYVEAARKGWLDHHTP